MSTSKPPLAVVGVSTLFPGSQDARGFWRDILAGRDLLSDVPPTHWLPEDYYDPDPKAQDKVYAKRGGFLSPVAFDAAHWGLPPNSLKFTDSTQLLALIVAEQVLKDAAREQFETMDRSRMSIILGFTGCLELVTLMSARMQKPVWAKSLREHGLPEEDVQTICQRIADHYVPWDENTFPGSLGNVVAGRIANRLNLGGLNCITDAACASAFSALSMAAQELYSGDSDLVITGAADTGNDPVAFACFSKTPALSPTGDCRPFSDRGDGTMLGEGVAMVALKRLADAERDGDRIYGLVRAVGASSDGRAKSVYAPVPVGQAAALRRALTYAGVEPRTVELVEAHGTGTQAGDAAEFEGLNQVYSAGDSDPDRQWCALGSVKSQVGHTKAAAGSAGLFKALMALHHKVLPPTIKVDRPNPNLGLKDSAFYLNTVARPWIRGANHPRRAGISAFGFGGSNFHVILEEYLGPGVKPGLLRGMPAELIVLSGRDGTDVAGQARALAARCSEPELLAWAAWHTQSRFDCKAPARLAVVAEDGVKLSQRLEAAAALILKEPGSPFTLPDGTAFGVGALAGEIGLLFPGQGSQYLAMGADLAMHFPAARAVWDHASDGMPGLSRVVFAPPRFEPGEMEADEQKLRETQWAQPAIGCASAALLALVRRLGLPVSTVAGHSFGEITALYAAGVLSETDFMGIARRRGELMADAASQGEPGAMTAVAASEERIRSILAGSGSAVVLANLNGPDQTILSGSVGEVTGAEVALQKEGLQARRLPVAAAFHSPLVAASVKPFAKFLKGVPFLATQATVYSGESASPYEAEAAGQRSRLGRQILKPVNFKAMIMAMADAGTRTFVEVGPGSVLSGLVGQILADRPHAAIPLDRRGGNGVTALLKGIAQLAALGTPLELSALWEGYRVPEDPADKPQPKLPVFIVGTNLEKPYPPPGGAAALPPPNPPAGRNLTPQAMVVPAAPGPDLLLVLQEAQRQAADGHARLQQGMVDAYDAYLKTVENSLQLLFGSGSGQGSLVSPPEFPAHQDTFVHPGPAPVLATPASSPAPEADLPAPASPVPPGVDLQSLMLAVVAEKTGYPQTMLDLSMDLEAELGIDSIKRVEILAAVQERTGSMLPVDAARLGTMRTLAQIADYLHTLVPAAAPASKPGRVPAAAAAQDIPSLILTAVAEKTGYPQTMLDLAMDLEADLGIDSIKRVEILAAVQERGGGMLSVDPARLGSMRTLAQIVEYLQGLLPKGSPAPEVGPAPLPPGIGRYLLDLVPVHASGMGRAGLRSARELVVTTDGGPIAAALVAELGARGIPARQVETVPDTADAVIFLGGLREVETGDQAMAINEEAFRAARKVAPRLAREPGVFVTVQDTGGSFGLAPFPPDRALLGGLPALAKTAQKEWPKASVAAIDLERAGRSPETLACVLADELLLGGGELEIALPATGRRMTLRSVAAGLPAGPGLSPIGRGDVVVVAGGARGLTAVCMVEWARRTGARFAVLGRTPIEDEPACCAGVSDDAGLKRALLAQASAAGLALKPLALARQVSAILACREIRATVAAIAQAGGEARYFTADAQDPVAVAQALERIRADWGPVTALVHAAGVLADNTIADLSDDDFHRVFDTKVAGLRVLLAATAGDPLKVLCLFSSISARCGNNGQAAYAMGNEILNKVAQVEARKRGLATLVKSLDWGPWEGGGMVPPHLMARFRELGVPLIPLAAGARMFVDEVTLGDPDRVEVVLGIEPRPEALVAAGRQDRSLDLEVSVDEHSHAFLADHSPAGTVVVPVALVVEWFSRTARAFRPDLRLTELMDLQVLRGIKLEAFRNGGQVFTIRCIQRDPGPGDIRVELSVLGADLAPHYQAWGKMAKVTPPFQALPALAGSSPWGGQRIYGDVLFHGPGFQVIDAIEGLGKEGIQGWVRGLLDATWPQGGWATDPLALDGALQLATLWARERCGVAVLPMGFKHLMLADAVPGPGPMRAGARCRQESPSVVVADCWVLDASGRPAADLRGVEFVVRPDWKAPS